MMWLARLASTDFFGLISVTVKYLRTPKISTRGFYRHDGT